MRETTIVTIVLLSAMVGAALTSSVCAGEWQVVPKGKLDLQICKDGAPLFSLDQVMVGPGWTRSSLSKMPTADDQGRRVLEEEVSFLKGWGGPALDLPLLRFRYEVSVSGPDVVSVRQTCQVDSDLELTGAGFYIHPNAYLRGGEAVASTAGGKTAELGLPPEGLGVLAPDVTRLVLRTAGHEEVALEFDRPVLVNRDRSQLRVWLHSEKVPGGAPATTTMTVRLPGKVTFRPGNLMVDTSNWFVYRARDDADPGAVFDAGHWMDAPAGKHGWLQIRDGSFAFEDGTPAKFWGINEATTGTAPEKEHADWRANRCAKYGANLVRFHKFARPTRIGFGGKGIMRNDDGTEIDPELAPRFDYFHDALWRRGVYVGWSAIYQYRLSPEDRKYLRGYDEIMALERTPGFAMHSAYLLACFCPDVQDRMIDMTVKLLNRKNTITGKRYADSPGLAYIELHNEDDIFFGSNFRLLRQVPTYKKWFDERYSEWLAKRYGSQETLAKAWGSELATVETLSEKNIDSTYYSRYHGGTPSRREMDNHLFLYHEQDSFYKRFVKAIRQTGFGGCISGSCWQARTWLGHLMNTYSDRAVGFIDRHNYGGADMLGSPGSGLLSAGMQQVADRPFGLTEWSAGGLFDTQQTPIIGIYGMGLQGWDLSAQFASFDNPNQVIQYPALFRAIMRGDVKEGEPAATRRVSTMDLFGDGDLGFSENFSLLGGANVKEFSSVVPQESLAVGRVLLDFLDGQVTQHVVENVDRYLDSTGRAVRSSTGQLHWDYSGRGYFTVDTPGTQAVVGFAGPSTVTPDTQAPTYQLVDTTISPKTPFAAIYVSALDPERDISDARRLLITALARTVPEGTVLDEMSNDPITRVPRPKMGQEGAAELVEPVVATFTLKRQQPFKVYPLDHRGRLASGAQAISVTRTVVGGRFVIDGRKHKTMYYLVEAD